MEAITPALFVLGAVNLLMFPILAWLIKRGIGMKLDYMDEKRDAARVEQAEYKKQREAERSMLLAIARTMLLNNYEKCMAKGYYTYEERDVFHELYDAYHKDGGNGIMEDLSKKIVELPTEPPKGAGD